MTNIQNNLIVTPNNEYEDILRRANSHRFDEINKRFSRSQKYTPLSMGEQLSMFETYLNDVGQYNIDGDTIKDKLSGVENILFRTSDMAGCDNSGICLLDRLDIDESGFDYYIGITDESKIDILQNTDDFLESTIGKILLPSNNLDFIDEVSIYFNNTLIPSHRSYSGGKPIYVIYSCDENKKTRLSIISLPEYQISIRHENKREVLYFTSPK